MQANNYPWCCGHIQDTKNPSGSLWYSDFYLNVFFYNVLTWIMVPYDIWLSALSQINLEVSIIAFFGLHLPFSENYCLLCSYLHPCLFQIIAIYNTCLLLLYFEQFSYYNIIKISYRNCSAKKLIWKKLHIFKLGTCPVFYNQPYIKHFLRYTLDTAKQI